MNMTNRSICSHKLIYGFIVLAAVATSLAQNDRPQSSEFENHPSIHGEPVYNVGGDVVGPRTVYSPDPEYSEAARLAGVQGTCLLRVLVGSDGRPEDVQIVRSLDPSLDQKSIDAVQSWRFDPATKEGQPVAVQIRVETSFRLYFSPGLPRVLNASQVNDTQYPDKHAGRYPLLVDVASVAGKRTLKGYLVTAEATISAGLQTRRVAINCHAETKCFMLNRGTYPGRSISANEIELMGRKDNDGKWQKTRFLVEEPAVITGPGNGGELELLTDTGGFDLGPYLSVVFKKIRVNWYGLIPDSAKVPEKRQGKVSYEFSITRDGHLEDVREQDSTGNADLDHAAKMAILESSPLPPIPSRFTGQNIRMRVHFKYNE